MWTHDREINQEFKFTSSAVSRIEEDMLHALFVIKLGMLEARMYGWEGCGRHKQQQKKNYPTL